MNCCGNCFGDTGLSEEIIPILSKTKGTCDFCESEDVAVLEPHELRDYFLFLTNIYEEDENGQSLIELITQDWSLFSHPSMDEAKTRMLLSEILDDGELVRKNFIPVGISDSDRILEWEELRAELKHGNRFFPNSKIDETRFEELLSRLIINSEKLGKIWYRARIDDAKQRLTLDEMGAPPKQLASHGRANPAGIPYLYLASDELTAISEIRPHPGEHICIAEFEIEDDLALIDLRRPRISISPFLLSDEEEISMLRIDIDFLETLGEELTSPVLPYSAAIDYIPSQYLCEFIKRCDYDGVVYNSSISHGFNISLFNVDSGVPQKLSQRQVTKVNVEVK